MYSPYSPCEATVFASMPQRNTKPNPNATAAYSLWINDEHRIPTAKVANPVRNTSRENFIAFHGEYDRPIRLATVGITTAGTSANTNDCPKAMKLRIASQRRRLIGSDKV
jgi:hypothetical protein